MVVPRLGDRTAGRDAQCPHAGPMGYIDVEAAQMHTAEASVELYMYTERCITCDED